MIAHEDNYVWYEYTDTLENWVNINDPDVQKFIATATPKQMEYFELACKILTLTDDIMVSKHTDDVHLQRITTFLEENENADFIQLLKEAITIRDYINAIHFMNFSEDNDVYYTYFVGVEYSIDAPEQIGKNVSCFYRPSKKIA